MSKDRVPDDEAMRTRDVSGEGTTDADGTPRGKEIKLSPEMLDVEIEEGDK